MPDGQLRPQQLLTMFPHWWYAFHLAGGLGVGLPRPRDSLKLFRDLSRLEQLYTPFALARPLYEEICIFVRTFVWGKDLRMPGRSHSKEVPLLNWLHSILVQPSEARAL